MQGKSIAEAVPVSSAGSTVQRLRMIIRGAVQGVGFRPFVYRLASELGLPGWVSNTAAGVFLEVEGEAERLRDFQFRIGRDKPAIAYIQGLESSFLDPIGFEKFEIRESSSGEKRVLVLPDIATCPACLCDIFDPKNRRYRYPFTNCTNCGPRFTIIESLPYDRPATTMKKFAMCPACESEYRDPSDRRFHAQPNACPVCGPQLAFWEADGTPLATRDEALRLTADALRNGQVVAIKGLGGFHLMVDARNERAIATLRERKRREEKPLAVMYPRLFSVRGDCEVGEPEERLLCSPESPIVLLKRKPHAHSGICCLVAPRNPCLGAMLPYTPLHHLLLDALNFPVVATSGNLSDEPICIDGYEALERLRGIADCFLVHDRPIVRHADDSIVRVVAGREVVLRRARGFAPLPVFSKTELPPLLAVGAHQKNTVAASVRDQIFVSQHIGDLETHEAYSAFERVIESFERLYEFAPQAIACDLHPNYVSAEYAHRTGLPTVEVQHHYAHVLACMAENELEAPVLGISWDGSGYGPDGTVWGGEFLWVDSTSFERVAHLRTFSLPGGEKAIKEPRRSAIGVLHELFADQVLQRNGVATTGAFTPAELKTIGGMLRHGINSPRTSSAGRLFDAVASLLDLRQTVRFEGQAAMELESLAVSVETDEQYTLNTTKEAGSLVLDWGPMVAGIRTDLHYGIASAVIARKFHNTLVAMMLSAVEQVFAEQNTTCNEEHKVALTGGCFQNKLLTELAVQRLSQAGYRVYWHQRIPPNDGGISVGQIVAAARELSAVKGG